MMEITTIGPEKGQIVRHKISITFVDPPLYRNRTALLTIADHANEVDYFIIVRTVYRWFFFRRTTYLRDGVEYTSLEHLVASILFPAKPTL